ncbi:MAG: transporter [Thermoprotei archaeon]|nr:MAG: transporter [Thermoprotei archaeon]
MVHSAVSVGIGIGVLVVIYVLLTFEILHRTAAAILGAAVVMILNIAMRFTDFRTLLEGIDLDTILLLMSMMIIVSALSRTGAFDYLASTILSRFKTKPFALTAILSGFTAAVSAFIDNVTTVLLISPVVIEISRRLRIDPRPVLLSIVFASNIGGTATLIGDPPNIIIGSVAKLRFMDFIENLAPIVVVDFFVFLGVMRLLIRRWLEEYRRSARLDALAELGVASIEKGLLRRVLVCLGIVIVLFTLEDFLRYPPAVPALIGAGLLMALARKRISIEQVLADVDWSTLVFFMAMFIVIKGVEELGVMEFIAYGIVGYAKSLAALLMLILWVSAFTSAFVDNIPFVMVMVPVISSISAVLAIDPKPLYWSLSLGGCLGGNGTLVGASANVVVAGIADKHGYHISFKSFMRYGMPVMVATVAVSALYLIIRYAL